jgi:hypothetical protein
VRAVRSPAAESLGITVLRSVRGAATWMGGGRVRPSTVLIVAALLSLLVGVPRALGALCLARLALEFGREDATRPPDGDGGPLGGAGTGAGSRRRR